ncbi:tRNA lysidine(34) synthetase TilS [Myxococcus sp. K15C18031901]|uniref:tRNA lysidine(34) synthetase TilS n=1 Tax=Myxococcus dinghuensis TaxID=2906761 RepID=UPI0020A75B12|nr:tRNA lysidine(34) synthetase TilS [Myxococcus dinghuensis]MCP3103507.1 tRNA lysidine(34) synthetase TilS [Myxococcus dinghuensis]
MTSLLTRTLVDAYVRLGLEGRSVLLAVSGGADSVALLVGTALVRERLRLRVEVATLDHGLRVESRAEVRAVVASAGQRGLVCHARELHLLGGAGVEARARTARYAALEAVRVARGLDVVATAHTADDQAETLLMRLARGSALRGAASIQESRPGLVRPLLGRTREELVAFLAEQGVDYSTDPMNADPSFFRARVRGDALPALSRAAGFPVQAHLAAFARLAAEDDALLSSMADAAWRRLRMEDGALEAVGVRALESPLRRRVLARLLTEHAVEADDATLSRVLRAVEEGGSATVGRGLRLRATGGRVRCVAPEGRARGGPGPELRLRDEGASGELEGTGWGFRVARGAPPAGVHGLALGASTRWPLTVRTRKPGDRIRTAAGQRRLQDLLVDLRVPAESRDARPVVLDAAGTVVWLPGLWSPPPRAEVSGHYLWATPPGPSNQRTPSL